MSVRRCSKSVVAIILVTIVFILNIYALNELPAYSPNKTPTGLASWAINAYNQGYGYSKGYYCQTITADNMNMYASLYPEYYTQEMQTQLNVNIQNENRMCDCVGLIKGYMWRTQEGIEVNTSFYPDLTATDLYDHCTQKGSINTMPDEPGIVLYYATEPHVGVYVGNGMCVHSLSYEDGIKYESVSKQGWTHWMKLPELKYLGYNEAGLENADSMFNNQVTTIRQALGFLPSDILAAFIAVLIFLLALGIARIVL